MPIVKVQKHLRQTRNGHILEGLGLDKSVWLHLISTSKIFMDCSMNKQTEEHKEFES